MGDLPSMTQVLHDQERRTLLGSGRSPGNQVPVGQGGEEIADGLQRGTVFEAIPGEERLGFVNDQHGRLTEGW